MPATTPPSCIQTAPESPSLERWSRPGPPRRVSVGAGRHTHLSHLRASLRHVRRAPRPRGGPRLRHVLEQAGQLLRRLRGRDELKGGARARGRLEAPVRPEIFRSSALTRTPGSGRACGSGRSSTRSGFPRVWRPARTCCRGVGTAESTQVWQNCADVELVATASEAEWHLASAEALARVPKPEKAAAAKFDPYKDATGDENPTATNRWRTARRSTTRRPSSSAEKTRLPLALRFAQSSRRRAGRGTSTPRSRWWRPPCSRLSVLGLEDPGWLRAFAVASAAVIAAVFQPPSAFERIAQPFLPPRVPVYLRDKT